MITHFIRTYGANPFLIENHISDSYTKILNDVGIAVITVPLDHPAVDGLQLDDEIEIWRGNLHPEMALHPDVDWRGLYRGYTLRTLGSGREVADLFAFHETELLARSIVGYPAGVANVTKFTNTAALNVMERIILDNFSGRTTSTLGAVARITAAPNKTLVIAGLVVPSSNVGDYAVANRNVLSILQELAELDGSFFAIQKLNAAATNWRVYINKDPSHIWQDRTSSVIFETRRENMADLELDTRTIGEITRAIVGGQGEGTSRAYQVRSSSTYNATTNHYEGFADGRDLTTTAALQAYADALIQRTRARPTVRFRPVQLPNFFYGRHYYWGDAVTVRHRLTNYAQRITQVAVTWDGANGETIQLGVESQ